MATLIWDKVGTRFFETGVDRGVLYPAQGVGVAWNGLTSVSETPSGGEVTPYYLDGIKYLQVSNEEEFGGTIEAYTYPDEFAECDGTLDFDGFSIHQQRRKSFGFSYRTRVGNDIDSVEHGYKIHLVYNALAEPTQSIYDSMSDDVEALTFAWNFKTQAISDLPSNPFTPLNISDSSVTKSFDKSKIIPFSHITIDSRKSTPLQMRVIESYLYGMPNRKPRLLTLVELFNIFENPQSALRIEANPYSGLSPIFESDDELEGDLIGAENRGLYLAPIETRLNKTNKPGLYTLE